ncbi:MAG: cation:proton antiporter [Xanthomonadales bacterium]|jgi:CPA2 family monovalent cation:H+ antiporter-2|nr:cation:proton antiporter [Xanthomonadales bacterium]
MPEHATLPYLREVLLFLALSGLLVPLLQKLKLNPVFGFLSVGVLIGPHALGALAEHYPWLNYVSFPRPESVSALAELGVLFLMFSIGLEISGERLMALKRWVFGTGTAQWLANALVLGLLLALCGVPAETAALLGLALALSSTAVVMPLLLKRQALGSPVGRASFSILLFQDLAVVPLLILIGFLASPQESGVLTAVALAIGKALIALALIVLIGRYGIRPLFRVLAPVRQPDSFTALVLLTAIGVGALTHVAGLSMALGAFLAGLILAETEYRHEVEITIEPFRGLLLGLFFLTVGMSIDLGVVARSPGLVLLGLLTLLTVKIALNTLVLRLSGLSKPAAVEGGVLLSQAGEFGFIVVGSALTLGLLAPAVGQLALVVSALSLFLTPALATAAERLGQHLRAREQGATELDPPSDETIGDHVIVMGFGRVGQLVGDLLSAQEIPYVAIDTDADHVARLHRAGRPVYRGEAGHPELLKRLGVERASAVVLTLDRPATAMHCLAAVRALAPNLPVIVRARDDEHARALKLAGASAAVPETLEAALLLARETLEAGGIDADFAGRLIDRERERRLAASG